MAVKKPTKKLKRAKKLPATKTLKQLGPDTGGIQFR